VVATVMGLGGLTGANPAPGARRLDTEFVEAVQRLDDVTFITPSDATRRVLCDLVGVDASSVTVIPLGVDHQVFHLLDDAVPPLTTRPTNRPYLLHVGPYSVRKNSQLLLEAFAASRRDDSIPHALVLAGPVDRSAVLGDASRLGLTDHVVIAGPLSDAELADAYRGATALCMPSRYEGFGLPVLEAMACGTPVIVSDSPALVEVAGEAAVVVHPDDGPSELAAAIGRLARSTTVRHQLRARGLARAASFTWTACARRHAECYLDADGRCDDQNGLYSRPPR
jgi:glycosyltransferase involved in cell wall biosynthesis